MSSDATDRSRPVLVLLGDVERAREHLAAAERSTSMWTGTAWQAATLEARAHLAAAEGLDALSRRLLSQVSRLFAQAGQPRDAQRCQQPLTRAGAERPARALTASSAT